MSTSIIVSNIENTNNENSSDGLEILNFDNVNDNIENKTSDKDETSNNDANSKTKDWDSWDETREYEAVTAKPFSLVLCDKIKSVLGLVGKQQAMQALITVEPKQ